MVKTLEDADNLFLYELGQVVLLNQDRWLADMGTPDRRQRFTVVNQILINSGAKRPEIKYTLGHVLYSNSEAVVSEHQIDHEASTPKPKAQVATALSVRPEDDPDVVPFVDHKGQLA